MKTFYKELFKMIKNNAARFIAMTLIIALGICFVTGLGGMTPKVNDSINEYYVNQNVPDIILKSKNVTGFSEEEITKLDNYDFINDYYKLKMVDIENETTRFYIYDFDSSINKLTLLEGSYPSNNNEIVVEQSSSKIIKRNIGEKVSIYNQEFTISGIVSNPMIISLQGDIHQISEEYLETIVYFSSSYCLFSNMIGYTDIYVKCNNVSSYFASNYLDTVDKNISSLEKDFSKDSTSILSLNETLSYGTLKGVTDKINIITLIFPLFFIAVVSLVCFTNISRLLTEERRNIGCLKSLGYSSHSIIFKYILFSLFCLLIGSIVGLITGVIILPPMVYKAFETVFILPTMTSKINMSLGIYSTLGMIISILVITFIVSYNEVKEIPASLFLQKSLKPGKKILLEKITFLWNKLSFKYKSTLRNVFRFKGRLYMIVISITGATILVMAGLGLYDVSSKGFSVGDFKLENTDAIKLIAIAIIIFAMSLSILVLYNITAMNIGERKRDIATLEVLGYLNHEVNGFIYREIFVMSIIGIIIGIPLGILFLYFVFTLLDFGGIQDIKITSYFLAFFISFIFVVIVTLITKHKIKAVDMNESLKSVE